jgi:hypothetical protein
MRAAAHDAKFAKKVGIPQKVADEFYRADKAAGKYAEGGAVRGGGAEMRGKTRGKVT